MEQVKNDKRCLIALLMYVFISIIVVYIAVNVV